MVLGECIGVAWHPTDGECRVFQDLDDPKHVVLVNRSGERRFMGRSRVQWRSRPGFAAQDAGHPHRPRPESPATPNVVAQPALFEMETP